MLISYIIPQNFSNRDFTKFSKFQSNDIIKFENDTKKHGGLIFSNNPSCSRVTNKKSNLIDYCDTNITDDYKQIIFIVGDSHAISATQGLSSSEYFSKNYQYIALSNSGCPAYVSYTNLNFTDKCHEQNSIVLKLIKSFKPNKIFIFDYSQYYLTGLIYRKDQNLSLLEKASPLLSPDEISRGLRIFIENIYKSYTPEIYYVLPNPELPYFTEVCRNRNYKTQKTPCDTSFNDYYSRIEILLNILVDVKNLQVIDSYKIFCNSGICKSDYYGFSLYYDKHHLSMLGSIRQAEYISDWLKNNK